MSRTRMRRGGALVITAALCASTVGTVDAQESGTTPEHPEVVPVVDTKEVPESPTGSYVVILEEGALVQHFPQEQLDSPAAQAQSDVLEAQHDQMLNEAGVGADAKLHSYEFAMNGFAAVMSQTEAEKLAGKAGVALVVPDELRQPTTDTSGKFLGLSGNAGVWATRATGEDVVIGVIDSGIWPEHPSVADDGSYSDLGIDVPCEFGTTEHELAPGFHDDPFTCNNKLIGARQVLDTYKELTGLTDVEYDSARDENGHGTHTATTAAGNAGVKASIFGVNRGRVTGVAPRARVIAYKALGELGGYGSDLAEAIDTAVEDGVDVINYSIGSSSFAIGPDDVAFLFAADAGVHVATSAGNSGPGAATLGSPSSVPWLTTVGASTHTRTYEGSATVTSVHDLFWKWWKPRPKGVTVKGASVTRGTGLRVVVDAEDLGNPLCLPDQGFSRSVRHKIVLCARGQVARIEKSRAVFEAGGGGMILYNENDLQVLMTDNHRVPSVNITLSDGLKLKAYIDKTRLPLAKIEGGKAKASQGSVMADFSSRGENLLSGDIIKPDVTAPGVRILAGNTPTPTTGAPGNLFQAISGTSMSSPHVAGLMALIDQVHPDWTPSMVKSALMTSARQDVVKEDGATAADPFDMGAGHVVPPSMFDPGIVYDAGLFEYAAFTCGAELGVFTPATCTFLAGQGVPFDPSDFNQASIAIGALPGSQTVTRTITNVSGADLTLTPSFTGLNGISAVVNPATIAVPAGGSASFEVTFTVGSAPVDQWAFGSMRLNGGGFSAYSPIALRPVAIAAPAAVSGTIEEGGTSFDVSFGYTGPYSATGHGLTPATVQTEMIEQDPDQIFDPADVGNGADLFNIEVADAALLRIHVPQVDPADAVDLDLFVFGPGGATYQSTNGGTNETVEVALPAAGTYQAYVHGWGVGTTPVEYTFLSWVVPNAAGGSLGVEAPATATIGTVGTVNLTWPNDLEPAQYLGAVTHTTPTGQSVTAVEVAPAPAP